MVGEMQFMIVYSDQDTRVQESKEMLIDQEKQEISAEDRNRRSFRRRQEDAAALLGHRVCAFGWLVSQECAAM
jgi:hypothetical protein